MLMESDDVRIGFIGAGVLGCGLALALDGVGFNIAAVASRRRQSADWLAQRIPSCAALESPQDVANAVNLVFITTPDAAIADVAASIHWSPDQGVAHCCGAASLELLESAANAGAATGAIHPFQTFAGLIEPADAARRLRKVTFAVAATGWLHPYLIGLAESMGGRAIAIPHELRPLYHASAVLACGYV